MKSTLAAALALFALCQAAAAEEDCRLTLAASLPMSPENIGRVIVPAEIDGKPLNLLVDTGSPLTGITQRAADRLGIQTHLITGDVALYAPYAGGRVTHFAKVKNFKLGDMIAPRAKFMVMPHDSEESDGLIGADFLKQFDVEFDFAAGKLNLFQPHPCPGKVVYWTQTAPVAVIPFSVEQYGGDVRIGLTLDGKHVPTVLDTGAPHTSISATTAGTWFDVDENTPGVERFDGGLLRYHFKNLSFEGIAVADPEIDILPVKNAHSLDFQALLGMNVLRRLHLFVAYREHKLYVTAASAH